MRDIEKGVVTVVRRHSGEKAQTDRRDIVGATVDALGAIAVDLLSRAEATMKGDTVTVESLDVLPDKLIRTGWCGSEDCGHQIEDLTQRNIIGTPTKDEGFKGMCVVCGKPTTTPVYIAKAM